MFDGSVSSKISRKAAGEAGLKEFFTGRVCQHGHVANRRVQNGVCLGCVPWGRKGRPPIARKSAVCEVCGKAFTQASSRERLARRHCSRRCSNTASSSGGKAVASKRCKQCGSGFIAKPAEMYCSIKCRATAAHEYSSTVRRYLVRMLLLGKRRASLTMDDLLSLYEKQAGRCALSGVAMTTLTGIGKIKTNLSLDQIRAGQGYMKDNVQLVCIAVNNMKWDWPQHEFLDWCRKIVAHQETANAK